MPFHEALSTSQSYALSKVVHPCQAGEADCTHMFPVINRSCVSGRDPYHCYRQNRPDHAFEWSCLHKVDWHENHHQMACCHDPLHCYWRWRRVVGAVLHVQRCFITSSTTQYLKGSKFNTSSKWDIWVGASFNLTSHCGFVDWVWSPNWLVANAHALVAPGFLSSIIPG